MDHINLIKKIRPHRLYIFLIMVITFSVGFFYAKFYCYSYQAITTIYISAEPVVNAKDADEYYVDISRQSESWATQQMLLNSNEMISYLNNKFKLYRHYQIDSNSAYSFDQLTAILKENISFQKKAKIDLYDLTFSDPNPSFAINFVNHLARKLDEMNKDLLIDRLKKKANIYKNVLRDLNDESKKFIDNLNSQFDKINILLGKIEDGNIKADNLYNFQSSLNMAFSDLKMISQKTSNAAYSYELAQRSLKEDNYPIIKVINKAVSRPQSYFIQSFFFGFVGMMLSLLVYVSVLFFIIFYKEELLLIFSK